MTTRRLQLLLRCALAVYTAFVLAVTLWPQRVDKPIDHQLRSAIDSAHAAGAPKHLGYSLIQNVANGGLFVPLGILLALVVVARLWWVSPTIALVLSTAIELTQHFFLPHRTGTIVDVISNTIGALVGAVLVVLFRALYLRYRRPRVAARSSELAS